MIVVRMSPPSPRDYRALSLGLLQEGQIKPVISRTFALAKRLPPMLCSHPEALRKIVLTVP